jgi:hypothetical protein
MYEVLQRDLFDEDYWSAAWGDRENVIQKSNTVLTSRGKLRNSLCLIMD